MGKGAEYERDLANTFDEAPGWSVVRSGGSGSGTTGDRPDLIAGNGDRVLVVEAKYSSDRYIYLTEAEANVLASVAVSFNAEAVAALRWNSKQVEGAEAEHYLAPLSAASETPSGKLSFKAPEIVDNDYCPLVSEIL